MLNIKKTVLASAVALSLGTGAAHAVTTTGNNFTISASQVWSLMSRDIDGDGINGQAMIDGPFSGFNANFNANVPVPAAVWLLGSGLLGLIGAARRRAHTDYERVSSAP